MSNFRNNIFCAEQNGFTIIEVMIAVAILAVGLLGIASMQMSAIRGNNLSDNITCALTLAEDKMESLLEMDYDNPDLEDIVATNDDDLSRTDSGWIDREELNIDETGKVNAGQYRRIWNIADNKPIENNKTVTVIVLWDNDSHQVSLTSVKRK
jgi:type IV pilus assembly protein PilV